MWQYAVRVKHFDPPVKVEIKNSVGRMWNDSVAFVCSGAISQSAELRARARLKGADKDDSDKEKDNSPGRCQRKLPAVRLATSWFHPNSLDGCL